MILSIVTLYDYESKKKLASNIEMLNVPDKDDIVFIEKKKYKVLFRVFSADKWCRVSVMVRGVNE